MLIINTLVQNTNTIKMINFFQIMTTSKSHLFHAWLLTKGEVDGGQVLGGRGSDGRDEDDLVVRLDHFTVPGHTQGGEDVVAYFIISLVIKW